MKAYQNKDGSWYVRVYDKNTKKKAVVTGATEKAAIRAGNAWYESHKNDTGITFGQALDRYISTRSAVVSPSTYREYVRMQRNDFDELKDVPIDRITSEVLQRFINNTAMRPIQSRKKDPDPDAPVKYRSGKTIRNIYGLATGVLSTFSDRRFRVTLPISYAPEPSMPSEDDVVRLVAYLKREKPEMYLPVLLALFVPCRRSEICALTSDDLDGNVLTIRAAVVQDKNKQWVTKQTKSRRGMRSVEIPAFVAKEIRKKHGKLTDLNPNTISSRWPHIARHVGMTCSFHGLRHWSDSYLHKKGLSDMEITARAGHSSQVMRNNYLHVVGKDRAVAAFDKLGIG